MLQRISTNLARLFAVAALAAVVTAPAAEAAVPRSGIWRGDLVHQLSFATYESTFVITTYRGRIQSVVATVRMECGSTDPLNSYSYGIRDARVVQSWRTGRGPRVRANGAFAFRADGAYIHGSLSRSSAIGGASANYGEECHGTGRFNAQRRR